MLENMAKPVKKITIEDTFTIRSLNIERGIMGSSLWLSIMTKRMSITSEKKNIPRMGGESQL